MATPTLNAIRSASPVDASTVIEVQFSMSMDDLRQGVSVGAVFPAPNPELAEAWKKIQYTVLLQSFDELASALPHLHAEPVSSDRAGLHEDMRFAAARANSSIIAAARREPDYEGMGSTLVIAVLMHDRMTVAHLGDSRCYRWRAGNLEQVTRDHCWVDEQIAIGALSVDAILDPRYRNIVTRALGIEDEIELEVHDHEAQVGDIFLLCSDGLTDMLDDAKISAHLATGKPLGEVASALVDAANEAGGRDNVSAILVQVGSPQSPGWAARLVRRLQGG